MKKKSLVSSIVIYFFSLIPFFNCFAEIKNPLIGKWRWDFSSCKPSEFIFSKNKLIQNINVDGEIQTFVYNEVKYDVINSNVTVDLGKKHSFSKTPDSKKLTFKIIDDNHLVLNRKVKSSNDFYRCP